MTMTKQLNGSWLCSTIDNEGQLIKHVYYGYSKAEAKNLFLKELADLIVQDIHTGKITL